MDERERKDIISSVQSALTLHDRANGKVSVAECRATRQVFQQGIESISRAVEGVHREVKEQRAAVDGLNVSTGELKVSLAEHVARHKGEERGEERAAKADTAKVMDRTYWVRVAATVLLVIGMLAGAAVYIDGKIDGIKDMVAGGKAGP